MIASKRRSVGIYAAVSPALQLPDPTSSVRSQALDIIPELAETWRSVTRAKRLLFICPTRVLKWARCMPFFVGPNVQYTIDRINEPTQAGESARTCVRGAH